MFVMLEKAKNFVSEFVSKFENTSEKTTAKPVSVLPNVQKNKNNKIEQTSNIKPKNNTIINDSNSRNMNNNRHIDSDPSTNLHTQVKKRSFFARSPNKFYNNRNKTTANSVSSLYSVKLNQGTKIEQTREPIWYDLKSKINESDIEYSVVKPYDSGFEQAVFNKHLESDIAKAWQDKGFTPDDAVYAARMQFDHGSMSSQRLDEQTAAMSAILDMSQEQVVKPAETQEAKPEIWQDWQPEGGFVVDQPQEQAVVQEERPELQGLQTKGGFVLSKAKPINQLQMEFNKFPRTLDKILDIGDC